MATAANQKALGAFYTSHSVATSLVRWAIAKSGDSVLDPSCGEGVFLDTARDRLSRLGNIQPKIWGIDSDPDALAMAKSSASACKILHSDFFSLTPESIGQFSAVVGNPPFIRYQRFAGDGRRAALHCAARVGVNLPQLSSSWAPFVVHSVAFVKPGGRLAMVVPAELGHAKYAQEVLRFLTRQFLDIRICVFRRKLFPELSEDTFLLLASGQGSQCTRFSISPFESIECADLSAESRVHIEVESVRSSRLRVMHYLLPAKTRHLYTSLSEEEGVRRLGDAADVGIGYVTGHNDFFHLSSAARATWHVPDSCLRPAVTSLAGHRGLVYKRTDWNEQTRSGGKAYLLSLPNIRNGGLPIAVKKYLEYGKSIGVHSRFKCRVRDPWYSVPHVRVGDAFLSYMSGDLPKLVLNRGRYVAPNTLHLVRFVDSRSSTGFVAAFYSSLTRLSCEMEGHPLGGGMLKLEPTEAERLLVAMPIPRDTSRLVS